MKFKKFLAGLLALSTAVLNVSVPISAEEVAEAEENITIVESIKTEETEKSEEPENTGDVPVASEGRIESYEIAVYDPEYQLYRDANGNVILPEDHHPMVKDYANLSIPDQYDTRTVFADKGYAFPEIKDQVSTGTCWAHAALAAFEIRGILEGIVSPSNCNFSEAHLNYFAMISDKDTSSDIYGDSAFNYTEPSVFNDYFEVYDNGGNQNLAASLFSRGTGPVYELPEWDIDYAEDDSLVIIDKSGSYPVIFDKISRSVLYQNSKGYLCYKKDGTEIVLNGDPYYVTYNIKNDLFFTPIDEQYRYQSEYTLLNSDGYAYNYSVSDSSSVDNIKAAIMEHGALTLGYYADTRQGMVSSKYGYYLPEKAFVASGLVTSSGTLPGNHQITVIGWNDSYSKNNFYCDKTSYQFSKSNSDGSVTTTTIAAADLRPQKDGAWLCRNSWGESKGDGGYFYISYEEPELREFYTHKFIPDNPYGDKIYQNYGAVHGVANLGSGHSIANIFTAESDDSIAAVSFFTYDYNTDYTVSVYTGASANSPMSGTLAAKVSGTIEHAGYHIVDLPSPVSISKGERFSVVLNTSDTKIFMDSYNKGTGISFFSRTSSPSSSADFYDAYASGTNVCIKALTSNNKKPSAPTDLVALPGDTEAIVYWTPAANADSYNVYRVSNGSYSYLGSVSGNYATITGLTNGTAYQFAVTAVKGSLESDPSESVTVTAKAGEVLYKAPTGLSGKASDKTVSLTWDAMTGATSYKVYYYTSDSADSATLYTTVTTNSCKVTGLTNDTKYYFWVSATYINGGESLKCSSVSATPISSTGPKATNLKAVPGDGQVTLSWSCQSNTTSAVYYGTTNDVSAAKGYKITRAQSITITGLTNGTRYYFWVKAGFADYSDVCSAVPGTVAQPDAPTGLEARNIHQDGTIEFTWDAVANASSYKFYYDYPNSSGGPFELGEQTETSAYYKGFTVNSTYYIYVSAVVNGVESPLSENLEFTLPSAPSNLTAAANDGYATLSWNSVSDAVKYNVYATTEDSVIYTLLGSTAYNSVDITNLTNGTTYYYVVTAVNSSMESDYSDVVSVTPAAASTSGVSITSHPTSMTIVGGTKFTMSVQATGTDLSFLWQYNNGSGWKTLETDGNVSILSATTTSIVSIYNTAEYKDCKFRCLVMDNDGNSAVSNAAALSFYDESNVTVSMVTALSSENLVNYVNYFTELNSGNFELTAAQLKAIELVLAADYAA